MGPSGALKYKCTKALLAVGADRNRIIKPKELEKLRKVNLAEGPAASVLLRAMTMRSERKKPASVMPFAEKDVPIASIL